MLGLEGWVFFGPGELVFFGALGPGQGIVKIAAVKAEGLAGISVAAEAQLQAFSGVEGQQQVFFGVEAEIGNL